MVEIFFKVIIETIFFTTPILVEIYAIQVILIKIMLTDALRIIVNRVRLMCTLRAHINHLFLETF